MSQAAAASPVRIAVVAPSNRRIGGQALHASALVESLRTTGYEAQLMPIDPQRPRWLAWTERVPYLRTLINQALYWPSLLRLRRADVVQASSASYWSFLLAPVPAMLVGRLFGKPVILNYHSGEAADHLTHWGRLVHPWLTLADEIVVPSVYLQSVFASHGYRSRVIHNTVDTSRFTYRSRNPLRPRLLSIRTFEWYYGVDYTVRAFALVKRSYPEATLDIAGTGSQEGRLRDLAASLKLDGIRFLGAVSADGMPAVLDQADILLNSSLVDNQPLSILEAMASGLAVVTTGVGDIVNMVEDGTTGTIVPQRNPEAMADAVRSLLKEPDRARDMAGRAYARLDRYAWSTVGGRWAALYDDVRRRRDKRGIEAERSTV